MKKSVRENQIIDLLHEKKRVSVNELCNLFNLSSLTIRNDLKSLENKGIAYRTHGGAVLREKTIEHVSIIDQKIPNYDERKEKMESIAKVAADYIDDNTWVYLSSGLTCYELARQLIDRKLSVVTGGVDIAIALLEGNSLNVFLPGGNAVKTKNAHILTGDWYLRALSEMRFDQSFISISGIDFDTGFSVNNSIELLHMSKIKDVSKETIIFSDSTKFNHQSFMSVANLDYADTIITNSDLPDDYRKYFNDHGIKLLTD